MKAQKKFLVPLSVVLVLLMASFASAALTIFARTPIENGALCQSRGNTIDLNVTGEGNEDGNLFAFYVTDQADGNFGIADAGNGNVHPDFNAFYMGTNDMNVTLTVPTSALASNFTTGNLTITIADLNGGSVTATTLLNVKPVWTQTEFTITSDNNTLANICRISDYTSVNKPRFTSSSNYIEFDETIDISGDLDFDASMALTNTSAEVDSTTLTTLANEPATIVWPNLATEGLVETNIEVWYNTGDAGAADQECPPSKCLLVTPTPGQIELSVSDFSTYSIQRADGAPWFPEFPDIPSTGEVVDFFNQSVDLPFVGSVSRLFIGLVLVVVVVVLVLLFKK